MTPQRRCPHCNFSLKPSFNSCICSCKHEYSEQITQLLFQPTDNTFVGDVCKNCGDIKNERLVGKKHIHLEDTCNICQTCMEQYYIELLTKNITVVLFVFQYLFLKWKEYREVLGIKCIADC